MRTFTLILALSLPSFAVADAALLFLERATTPVMTGTSDADRDGATDSPELGDDDDDPPPKKPNPLDGPDGSDGGEDPELEDEGYKTETPPLIPLMGKKVRRWKVAFVLDKSGSMVGAMGKLKTQVDKVLTRLTPKHQFTIMFYDGALHFWKRDLVKVTPANVKAARAFVASKVAKGGTEPAPALRAALKIRKVEQVFFVTDGRLREHAYKAAIDYLRWATRKKIKKKRPPRLEIIPVLQEGKTLEDRYASRLKVLQALVEKQAP